eukprot:7390816-Prymnesium_polylepis.1
MLAFSQSESFGALGGGCLSAVAVICVLLVWIPSLRAKSEVRRRGREVRLRLRVTTRKLKR